MYPPSSCLLGLNAAADTTHEPIPPAPGAVRIWKPFVGVGKEKELEKVVLCVKHVGLQHCYKYRNITWSYIQ